MNNLYRWQKLCLEKWQENSYHGLVDAVTGTGKTILALAAIDLLKDKNIPLRVRIVVPKISLTKQWKKEIISYFPFAEFKEKTIGIIGGGRNSQYDSDFSIYVINSARYCLSKHIRKDYQDGYYTLLIADECHHYGSEYNRLIFRFFADKTYDMSHYFSLGLSATLDSEHLEDVLIPSLGKVIYKYDLNSAIKDKRITNFVVYNIALNMTGDESHEYGELTGRISTTYRKMLKEYPEFSKLDTKALFSICNSYFEEEPESLPAVFMFLIRKRRDLINDSTIRYTCTDKIVNSIGNDRRIIIFTERISQCDMLYELLTKQKRCRVAHYHSKMNPDVRKNNLESFANRETDILVTCKALDEGLNIPDACAAIVFSSSSINRQRVQRLGRILRKTADKKLAVLYYLYIDNTVDDIAYLNFSDDFSSIDCSYDPDFDSFYCDVYAKAALRVYNDNKLSLSEKKLKELSACIDEGLIRADWFLDDSIYEEKISNASGRHERNYWLTMKKIASEYSSEINDRE